MPRIAPSKSTRVEARTALPARSTTFACLLLACLIPATARSQPLEVVVQSGHLAEIRDVAFSPDGCYLATAGADNRVKLWDETSGKEIRSLRGGYAPHTAVAFAPDGESLLIALERGPVTEWHVNGTPGASYATGSTPRAALSRDGRFFAAGGGEARDTRRRITVWDRQTGTHVASYVWNGTEKAEAPHLDDAARMLDHDPKDVAISPNGDYVASAGGEGRAALWPAGEPAPLRFYTPGSVTEDMRAPIIVVAFSPDGRYLAGAYRTTAYLWPMDAASPVIELTGQASPITALAFSDDGRIVATGNSGGEVWLFDAATGVKLGQLRTTATDVLSLAFKPTGGDVRCRAQLATTSGLLNGRILATSGREPVVRIWSLGDSSLIRALTPKVQPLNSVAFSPDGNKLALASSADRIGSAKVWDLASGYDVSVISAHQGGGVNAVAFFPKGEDVLVTGGADTSTRFWDTRTLAPLEQIGGPPKPRRWLEILGGTLSPWLLENDTLRGMIGNSAISASLMVEKYSVDRGPRAFAFDAEGKYLAIGGSGKAVLWDRKEKRLVENWESTSLVSGLAFAADGKSLFAVGGLANRSSVETGKEIGRKYTRRYTGSNSATSLVLLDGGARLALAYDDGLLEVRELDPRRDPVQEIRLPNPVTALRLSPDGSVLVAGDSGGSVTVLNYDGKSLMQGKSFEAHSDTVFSMDFRHDGGVLATASSDGTARLWNTKTWQEIVAFVSIGVEDYVILSPDNTYAASTNGYYGLAFRRGNVLYPFEQFDLALNRPDLVFQRLGTVRSELLDGYREAHAKRLRRMNVTANDPDEDVRLPQVGIEDLPRRATTTERELSFTLVARDAALPIERLQVWVNDVPLYGSAGLEVAQPAREVRQPVRLQLSEGRNKVQVTAFNVRGAESVRATIETIYQPPQGTKPDLHIVAIGVSEYADARYNLAYAANDASSLITALSAQRRFAAIHPIEILNAEATRERILAVKRQLMATDVDDEVVVFVAGHGLLDSSLNYYFATADMDFANPAARGISDDEIEGLLDGIPSRRKLLLMDTCFSGEVDTDRTAAASPPAPIDEGLVIVRPVRGVQAAGTAPARSTIDSFRLMEKLFANLGRGSGSALISASGGDEFAFESTGNGVFTHSILEAVAATQQDQFLRLSELRARTVARVRQLTAGRQTPSIRRVNLEFDYPVYSVETPDTGQLPEIDSFEFGKLFVQLAQIENLED
jgi:WD40 repeat protein